MPAKNITFIAIHFLIVFLIVTMDHKTSHKGKIFKIKIILYISFPFIWFHGFHSLLW